MPGTRWAEVDLGAIRHNVRQLRARLREGVRLAAVVKANAYGHGIVPVGRAAVDAGADWLAVATTGEGLELRAAGIDTPILNMGPTLEGEADAAVRAGLRLCVYEPTGVETIAAAAKRAGETARVHLKVDTGMSRLGSQPGEETLRLARLVADCAELELEALWTHLAESEDPASGRTAAQLESFMAEVQRLDAAGLRPPMLHSANSGAVLLHPESHLDMVRCCIAVYGYSPIVPGTVEIDLRTALTWKARVAAVRDLAVGDRVGYGGTYTAQEPARLCTISIGYGDGYQRRLSNAGHVLIRGRRLPVVGRVSMDYITVASGPLDGVEVGEEVVLLGDQAPERIGAVEIAETLGTISYEVLCQVGPRVPRVYLDA